VAGKRAGIQDGERSNLFFEAVRIIKEMREATNGEYPKYAVWENVPGAFSSNKGYDFHAVLEALCSVCDSTVSIPKPYDAKRANQLVWSGAGTIVGNGYSVAWRTLDAQYWGVPQRRKRIYLVADFTGRRAGEILFKPDSLRGDFTQGDEARKGATVDAMGSVDGSAGECIAWTYRGRNGGVKTNIQNKEEFEIAWEEIQKNVEGKNIEGILVQEMLKGNEVALGMKKDSQFGPVLMFGLGGIFIEIIKDVSFRVAPLNKEEAMGMIKEIKGFKILEGARGRKKVDLDKIVEIIVSISNLSMKEENIQSIDFNPVMINENRACIADFRIIV
jgi:hypothetical protein